LWNLPVLTVLEVEIGRKIKNLLNNELMVKKVMKQPVKDVNNHE
jgi:hypothetical protein